MIWLSHFIVSKGGIILATLVLLMLLERAFPMVKVRSNLNRIARNFSLVGLNALLGPLIIIPITAYAAGYALHWRPDWWSGWAGLVIDFLILDCWIYGWHRLNHVVPFLWRFHEVHHLDEHLDATSALRFHFGEVVLSSLVRAVVILLLGLPLMNVAIFETMVTVAAIFHHSNLNLPDKIDAVLSYIIVTPSLHWVHHHALRGDTDSNYSTIFSLWDRLFASRNIAKFNITMKMGVEGLSDVHILRLILRPFYKA
jgi:sterol desaturase/sphingolipid hydroxylase (fatty acid hydroxylase superfamily)